MLDELTPDQRAKLARGWVWQEGHLPVGSKSRVSGYLAPRELTPDLNDPVTADGLLRTARAMWRDESLHVVPVGVDFTVSPKRVLRWRLRRAVYWLGVVTEEWGETGWITSAVECPRPIDFASEEAALLAAILVAPEHQNV